MENNVIIQYARDNISNEPFGCVVSTGINESGEPKLGWSLCHPSDHFQKEIARKIAIYRCEHFKMGTPVIEMLEENLNYYYMIGETKRMVRLENMLFVMEKVFNRAESYFK